MRSQISLLLNDGLCSSLLTQASVIIGRRCGHELAIGPYVPTSELAQQSLHFRRRLIDGVSDLPFAIPPACLPVPDEVVTRRGLTLNLAASLYAWCRAGKRVWRVTSDVQGEELFNLPVEAFPLSHTMLWLEKPAVGATHQNQPLTCNLVMVERFESKIVVRLFCNPVPARQTTVVSYREENELLSLLAGKEGSRTKNIIVGGRPVVVAQNIADALRLTQRLSDGFASYPYHHPGSLVVYFEADERRWTFTHHLHQGLIEDVLRQVTLWAKMRLEQSVEEMPYEVQSDQVGRDFSGKPLPHVQRIFEPEAVFDIRRSQRVGCTSAMANPDHRTNTGRMITVAHVRSPHMRTLHRGTERERQVPVGLARVVPKVVPGVAPGVVVVPRKPAR